MRPSGYPASILALPLLLGCSEASEVVKEAADDPAGAPSAKADLAATISCPTAEIGRTLTVPLFVSGTTVSGVSGPSYHQVTATAAVPSKCYSRIVARFAVHTLCNEPPAPGANWTPHCDPYDRNAWLALADGTQTPLLLVDAVTPFGGDAAWQQDVTDYAIALLGTHSYLINIDVGADPKGLAAGTQAAIGVTAQLTLTIGPAPRNVAAVQPLFFEKRYVQTAGPIDAQMTAPPGATHARLDFYSSGHGLTGPNHCDEFCPKENVITIDGAEVYRRAPWVDCSDNCTHIAIPSDCGGGETYDYSCWQNPLSCPTSPPSNRSGWCPSQSIPRRPVTLSQALASGSHAARLTIPQMAGFWVLGGAVVYLR